METGDPGDHGQNSLAKQTPKPGLGRELAITLHLPMVVPSVQDLMLKKKLFINVGLLFINYFLINI